MLVDDFRRVVTAFADSQADIDLERGTLLMQLRDDVIEARLSQRGGQLLVEEAGERLDAASWLTKRVARIPMLADRILAYVDDPSPFVAPEGRLLDQPDFANSVEDVPVANAAESAIQVLGRQPAGTTSVLYLTSDAGEGKTTLIRHLAIQQAREYKAKRTDWLLLPIPLGGRTFLRFDDVVVGALVNNLRFQLFYFEAFLEMVRLGVIVPAFDGFEEMIVEGSMGEAISALGSLVRSLESSGTLLVAVRKAYFEYRSFRAQAKLFDAVGSGPVAFARLALQRWTDQQFLSYGQARALQAPDQLYAYVRDRLGADHPLLTRAVLVRRLVDLAKELPDLSTLVKAIEDRPQDYFFQFVQAIVEREAREKWLDQASDPAQPLLSVDEHHELLAMIAQELWMSNVESLRADVVATIADVFAEAAHKTPIAARQIRERLKQHALLVSSGVGGSSLTFDHEDFRVFYLGEALGRVMRRGESGDLRAMLQVGLLPRGAIEGAAKYLKRHSADVQSLLAQLAKVASGELPTSFARENCGGLVIRLLDGITAPGVELAEMTFPSDALRGRKLTALSVKDAYFEPTSLEGTELHNCRFTRCRFERLEIGRNLNISATLEDCECGSLLRVDRDDQLFDPVQILQALAQYGFTVQAAKQPVPAADISEPDEETVLLERALRIFLRATQVNESVLRLKFGSRASHFSDHVLPGLLKAGVLEEIPYKGSGVERRFKVGVPMHRVQQALAASKGNFDAFLSEISTAK